MNLLTETTDSIPLIFLITDGSVEDERDICNFVKESLRNRGSISPRLCTFGIGKDFMLMHRSMLVQSILGSLRVPFLAFLTNCFM